jgi:hypothetical protein
LDPPLNQAGRGWLLLQAIALALIAAAQAAVVFWAVQYMALVGGVIDPDPVLLGISAAYVIGVWLLTWPQPADPRKGWQLRLERSGMRVLALAAPVSVWMLGYDWWYVPWWDFGRYQRAVGGIVLLIGICQWLIFDHLSHAAARSRAGPPPDYFRAGRHASAFAWLAVCFFWAPDHERGQGYSLPGNICCCPPAALVVYLYPPALLVAAVVMFVREARAAGRGKAAIHAEPQ